MVGKDLLFVNKKKQKNFINLIFLLTPFHALCIPILPILLNESFCFFFQKEDFLLHLD